MPFTLFKLLVAFWNNFPRYGLQLFAFHVVSNYVGVTRMLHFFFPKNRRRNERIVFRKDEKFWERFTMSTTTHGCGKTDANWEK